MGHDDSVAGCDLVDAVHLSGVNAHSTLFAAGKILAHIPSRGAGVVVARLCYDGWLRFGVTHKWRDHFLVLVSNTIHDQFLNPCKNETVSEIYLRAVRLYDEECRRAKLHQCTIARLIVCTLLGSVPVTLQEDLIEISEGNFASVEIFVSRKDYVFKVIFMAEIFISAERI